MLTLHTCKNPASQWWLPYHNTGGPLDDADTEGTAEAEQAAAQAHDVTDEPDEIVNALEAAEAKYAKDHPEDAANPGTVIPCIMLATHFEDHAYIHERTFESAKVVFTGKSVRFCLSNFTVFDVLACLWAWSVMPNLLRLFAATSR